MSFSKGVNSKLNLLRHLQELKMIDELICDFSIFLLFTNSVELCTVFWNLFLTETFGIIEGALCSMFRLGQGVPVLFYRDNNPYYCHIKPELLLLAMRRLERFISEIQI